MVRVRNYFAFFILTLTLSLFSKNVCSQYSETIRSGRPGLAIGPFTVGKGVFQNQSGFYNIVSDYDDDTNRESQNSYAIAVFRGGLTERFELGCAFSYAQLINTSTDSATGESQSSTKQGIDVFTLAMRVNISEGKGLMPAFGYQVNVGLPWGSENFRSDYSSARLTLLTAQSFEKFRFITNWAGIWNGTDAKPSGIYMLFLDRGFGKKFRFYLEHYGIVSDNLITPKFDVGLTYLINNDVQLDAQYGNGPEFNNVSDQFISIGIGWRVRLVNRPVDQ